MHRDSRSGACPAKIPFPWPGPGRESCVHDGQICNEAAEGLSQQVLPPQILSGMERRISVKQS